MKDFDKYARSKNINPQAMDAYIRSQNSVKSSMSAYILEERPGNLAVMDIFSRLMCDRIIFLGTEIDDITSNIINAQLLYLDTEKDKAPIKIYINSPGGDCYSGRAVLDCMDIVKSDVETVCLGLAASMGAVILAHGKKGARKATPRSRVMIHQPWGGAGGNATQIDIAAKEYNHIKESLALDLSLDTGRSLQEIIADCENDKWFNAEEAQKYGLIDKIIIKK